MESVQRKEYTSIWIKNQITNIEIGKWQAENTYPEREKVTLQRGGMKSRQHTQMFACTQRTSCTTTRVAAQVRLMPFLGGTHGL